jgi:hypothetical protein
MLRNEHHNNLYSALNIITKTMLRAMGLVGYLSRLGQGVNVNQTTKHEDLQKILGLSLQAETMMDFQMHKKTGYNQD